ncbi:MAG: hypothetical protein ACRD21_18945 [Vicinamibacteria bacterium]
MRRREALFSLLGAGALAAGTASAQDLSPESVRQMLRALGGFEPSRGEEENVRAFLLAYRFSPPMDPGVEPAVTFDPDFGP